MTHTAIPPPSWRAAALRRIEAAGLAGHDPHHARRMSPEAGRGLLRGDLDHTLGIVSPECAAHTDGSDVISPVTGCPPDSLLTPAEGAVTPLATLRGLEEAARRIDSVARGGGNFLVATGHPGNLLLLYMELACLIRDRGGRVIEPARGAWVPPNLCLDYMAGVAVTTDGRSLLHAHDCRAMELMLEAAESVDLVVADHGFAGAAIVAGIPVVAVLNANDPLPALARRLGADVTLIPMDGNLSPSAYLPLAGLVRDLVEAPWVEAGLPEYSVAWCDRGQRVRTTAQ
jgi:hypothetical protein